MSLSPQQVCNWCFAITLFFGMAWVAIGVMVVPLRHHIQLDVVLTPEELADARIKEKTLEMLKRTGGNEWVIWTVAGAGLMAVSGVGLVAVNRIN